MAGHRLQATALCLLALALCASATSGGYGYYGHRRLTQASGFHRDLLSYYYGGHRRLSSYYYGARASTAAFPLPAGRALEERQPETPCHRDIVHR
ncbi:hypothetical protein CHLNCDRAFT_139421 [Chlorella variabilis]|uniref:Uncharacterized protein n=1 Tax=Chlorella variabilis TaxID=554065 RepID=E1ZPS0_CHLVA|nr:hypothetical protein CHLNCDRAFT_139421 [Chlorella variabilis]EFN52195.1 hypothetical protein CHLNCDRAFT_139421 [Chlorella variabilis]|eukprot:XP_005844297.1 hypothetical protein CHLNCDRAFT_139421 [Chlorella variabilis]